MKMFVNLPIKKLADSMAFWGALGFSFNPQFTSETTTCMIVSEDNYVMLLEHADFGRFTDKAIIDPTTHREVLIALALDSRADVDAMAEKVIANGGTMYGEPVDYGFMYQRAFIDIDGHHWEPFFMDPTHVQ
jgi:predicted lactoylglutathione lyase